MAGFNPDQPRDDKGQWAVVAQALAKLKPNERAAIKQFGVRARPGDVGGRIAGYKKYPGVVLFEKRATPESLVHEYGHVVDQMLGGKGTHAERVAKGFEALHPAWSHTHLKKPLAEDYRRAPHGRAPWDNARRAWDYAFSSTEEAFAHAFAHLRKSGDEWHGDARWTFPRVFPRTLRAVQSSLKRVRVTPSRYNSHAKIMRGK